MTAHKDMMRWIIRKKELATETGLQARESKSNTLDPFKRVDDAGGENQKQTCTPKPQS